MTSSVVSGLSGYAVLVLAARHLNPADNADFLVFWGWLFGVFGVLIGLSSEMTRTVFTAEHRGSAQDAVRSGARAVPVTIAVGVVIVLVVAAMAPVWGPPSLGVDWVTMCATVVVGGLLFTTHVCFAGAASGRKAWRSYALLVSAEATMRVVLVAVAGILGAGLIGHAAATALAAGASLLIFLLHPGFRWLWSVRSDATVRGLARRAAVACTTAAASAVFLVAFPVLVRLTTSDAVFAGAAPLILAVSLTRAPLLMPLGAFQSVIITHVIARGARALVLPILLVAGVTVLGVGPAALIGPPVLKVVNPDYVVSPQVFALLTVAAGLVTAQALIAATALALDRHGSYLAGWIVTSAIAVVALLRPGSLDERVLGALLLGPLVGGAVHLLAAVASARRGTTAIDRKAA